MVDIFHKGQMYTPKKEFKKLQAENEALKNQLEGFNIEGEGLKNP